MFELRRKIGNFKISRIGETSSLGFKTFTNKNLHGINLKSANLYPTPPDNKWNMDSIGQQIKLDIQIRKIAEIADCDLGLF